MSTTIVPEPTFASGRYSKRKRTQIAYNLSELDVSDSESDFDAPQVKIRKVVPRRLPKRHIFPFLQLPAEIRNMIYEYALVEPSGINLMATFKNKRRTVERVSPEMQDKMGRINDEMRASYERPIPLCTSLLGLNKQIHAEARDILYSNEFICNDTFALYSFLINLGPHGAKYLKKLRLLAWGYGRALKGYNHASLAVLAWATNLATFLIATRRYYSPTPKGLADQLYRDGFPWMEALGRETGKVDAVLDVVQLREGMFEQRVWNGSGYDVVSGEQREEEFRNTLRKLLGAQQKRMQVKPTVKKRKLSVEEVTDEL